MSRQQMLDDGGDALIFLGVELRVLEEGNVPRAPDAPNLAQHAARLVAEFLQFLAGGVCKHGRKLYKVK
jgi:hypothetical protein